jgi:hypothetical protein
MDKRQFWRLIEAASNQAANPSGAEAAARRGTSLPAAHPVEDIVAAQQVW